MCYCNVGVACYKVGRLVLCGKYFTSSTVSVHMCPLYSICTSILPTFCLLSTGSRHICVHGTCIPSYVHCISASIALVLRPLSCFCKLYVGSTCGCGLLSEGVCHLYGRKKKKVVCLFFSCSAFRQLLSCFYFSF